MLERGVIISVALLAASGAGFSLRDARAAYLRELGLQAATQAVNMDRGPARDAVLDVAQDRLTEARDVLSRDPAVWRALAQTRFLQATGAQVSEISQPLLQASINASRQAEALDPTDSEAPGRLAQAMALSPTADKAQAAAALERSFTRRAMDPSSGTWRVQTAALLWPSLNVPAQQSALAEACMIARTGAPGQTAVQSIVVTAPAMDAAYTATSPATTCAPGLSLQNPNN